MSRSRMIIPTRKRTTEGSFGFVPHSFLRCGFWDDCSLHELVVYFFLSLASDRFGVSFHGRRSMARRCRSSPFDLEQSFAGLAAKDLIALDGERIQLLSLPSRPVAGGPPRGGPASVAEALHAFTLELDRRSR